MLLSINSDQSHVLYVAAQPIHLRTHWLGRTIICPGRDVCSACKEWAAEDRYYAMVYQAGSKTPVLWEFTEATLRAMRKCFPVEEENLVGRVISVTKKGKRRPLKVEELEPPAQRPLPLETQVLLDTISDLFRMPKWPSHRWHAECLALSRIRCNRQYESYRLPYPS